MIFSPHTKQAGRIKPQRDHDGSGATLVAAKLLTRDEARRIAPKIAKLSRGCFAGCMDPGART